MHGAVSDQTPRPLPSKQPSELARRITSFTYGLPAVQVAKADEATSALLQRQVARTFGSDAIDLLLRYQVRARGWTHG